VILKRGKIVKKTKVIPKTLDPAWNEGFLFPLTGEWHKEDLNFKVLDHDLIRKNELLGKYDFSFAPFVDLPFEDAKVHTVKLEGEDAKGDLTFVFSFHKEKPKRENFHLHDPFIKKTELQGIDVDDVDVEGKRGKFGRPHLPDVDINLPKPKLPDVDIDLPRLRGPKIGARGKKEIGEMEVEYDADKQVWKAKQVVTFEAVVSVTEQEKKSVKFNLEYSNGLQQKINKVIVWIETNAAGKDAKTTSKKEIKLEDDESTVPIKYDFGETLEPSSDKVVHKLYLEFRFASSFATILCAEHLHIK